MFAKRFLIRLGKVTAFIFSFIVLVSHIETIYSIITWDMIYDADGYKLYNVPISDFLGSKIYIDWYDVLLCFSLWAGLDLCYRNLRACKYLALNLVVRYILENADLDETQIILFCATMSILGIVAVYGGFKMIPAQKGKF